MTVELNTLSYYKTEQDTTDTTQDSELTAGLATKADKEINMRGVRDGTTLYISLDGSDPTPV